MNWIVDTCVVIDLLENDPDFGLRSARLLEQRLAAGASLPAIHAIFAKIFPISPSSSHRLSNQ
jgi:hypothetical protein